MSEQFESTWTDDPVGAVLSWITEKVDGVWPTESIGQILGWINFRDSWAYRLWHDEAAVPVNPFGPPDAYASVGVLEFFPTTLEPFATTVAAYTDEYAPIWMDAAVGSLMVLALFALFQALGHSVVWVCKLWRGYTNRRRMDGYTNRRRMDGYTNRRRMDEHKRRGFRNGS